ncbi:MAG: hypothetical protein ACRC0G_10840 [Fusobacteriaceae bacterium]
MANKNEIEAILGFELVQKEVKKYVLQNPKVRGEIEEWLSESMGKGHLKSIRKCNLHLIDTEVDESDLDEHELIEYRSKLKHNKKTCPSYELCPVYLNGTTSSDEKCVLELVETQFLINGLVKELDVDPEDFNDQIVIGQLVTMNILYNRAMEGLASTPMIEEIKTFQKGSVNIDTKISEYFVIAERCLHQMDKLRKSLVLNRDDKIKVKMIKKSNSEAMAKKKVEEKMRVIEAETSINDDLISSILSESVADKKTETKKENSDAELLSF